MYDGPSLSAPKWTQSEAGGVTRINRSDASHNSKNDAKGVKAHFYLN